MKAHCAQDPSVETCRRPRPQRVLPRKQARGILLQASEIKCEEIRSKKRLAHCAMGMGIQ